MSLKPKTPIFIVNSPSNVLQAYPLAWVHSLPRFGDFAVEDDRSTVSDLMLDCMRRRVLYLKENGSDFEWRFTQALSAHAIKNAEVEEQLPKWLESYSFSEALESGPLGWAPIHFAALEANTSIVASLLKLGEQVDRLTTEGELQFQVETGLSPLMVIAYFVADAPKGISIAQLLLQNAASMTICSGPPFSRNPLHCAAVGASEDPSLCSLLLDKGSALEGKDGFGFTPLLWACYS
jgi:ankyrin repeat protein